MSPNDVVIIEAALNGGRERREHPHIPMTPDEIAAEARGCADEGASLFHVHARDPDGEWNADPTLYATTITALRRAVPGALVSITSIRPSHVAVDRIVELLTTLSAKPETAPDLISVNLGHIVRWEPSPDGPFPRRTIHFPNAYEEIVPLLSTCATYGITPELGLMDLGFVSNAVTLHADGLLPAHPWFLLELDSPRFGSGDQVAPATVTNYEALAAPLVEHFPNARWAAHGQGLAGYAVIHHALTRGAHVRVGYEDSVHLPNGDLADSNAGLVAWAVAEARAVGRTPATPDETRQIIGPAD